MLPTMLSKWYFSGVCVLGLYLAENVIELHSSKPRFFPSFAFASVRSNHQIELRWRLFYEQQHKMEIVRYRRQKYYDRIFPKEWYHDRNGGDGGGGGDGMWNNFEFSNKAKYDYILENKIAIRNQIKIIKFHSPKKRGKSERKMENERDMKMAVKQLHNGTEAEPNNLAKCNNLKWKDITIETKQKKKYRREKNFKSKFLFLDIFLARSF